MHELGMCEDIIHAIDMRAEGRRVEAVGVRAGVLLRVVDEAFAQSFEMASGGTVAQGAEVELTIVPAAARCSCGTAFEAEEAFPACPTCAGSDVEVTGGDELILEWLRYADVAQEA
jgi:hydrogenase nickel incorporation protein HypA/HybF